jgi:predicted RNase H-like HicB family nuclease
MAEITVIFEPAPEGGYTAYIPEVPGAVSEGETIDDAREMVLEAMQEILEYRHVEVPPDLANRMVPRQQILHGRGPE